MTLTQPLTRLNRPRQIMLAALLVGCVGMLIQIASGVHYGTVPPGLVIMIVSAAFVAYLPWRWTPAPVAVVAAFVLIGGFASTNGRNSLQHPGHLGAFIGILILLAALAIAVIAGIAALAGARRP